MNVISVCSGVGGLDLGFERAGFHTVAMCEVDPFRRKVLAHRFPNARVWPDLTTLDPSDLPVADILIGGTPCQDLSIAGQQAGLEGDKSRLYWDYQRIRLALGIKWALWENVEGALSSNGGLDFAQVLAAFVGADVDVPGNGWAKSGVATGPWGGCVWRLLDAQYFGVPQRRRRIFVAGHLGGPCPPEILLEPARRQGRSAQGREAGTGATRVANALTRGSGRTGNSGGRRQEDDFNIVVSSLQARNGRTGDTSAEAAAGGQLITHTLTAVGFDASEDGTGRGTPLVSAPVIGRYGKGTDSDANGLIAGTVRSHQRPKSNGADLIGAAHDPHGVRTAHGLAGWLDRSSFDNKPDGRRYSACGDGVVAPVAEWIAGRLMAAVKREELAA